jgi:hypothetical protein
MLVSDGAIGERLMKPVGPRRPPDCASTNSSIWRRPAGCNLRKRPIRRKAAAGRGPPWKAPSGFMARLYFGYPLRLVFLCRRDHPLVDRMGNGMGRRSRMRAASMAELAVMVLGVVGLLGFLMAGRMDDANASPFDIFAFVWFFTFAGIKLSLPWPLKRAAARRSVSG